MSFALLLRIYGIMKILRNKLMQLLYDHCKCNVTVNICKWHIYKYCLFQHTQKQAIALGLRGWCQNTRDDTVKGIIEGKQNPMNEMQLFSFHIVGLHKSDNLWTYFYRKHWLQTKGSPTCRIDKAIFSEMKDIENYTFRDFSIKK